MVLATEYNRTLSNLHPAIVKLKKGRVSDVTVEELTHPRITHLYNQEQILLTSLGEKYGDCIRRLHQIKDPVSLEEYMYNIEIGYRESLIGLGYSQGNAFQMAHDVSRSLRKVWYRMRTNFDTIEELHRQRVEYIQTLGDYLHGNRFIRRKIDLMLMIKDMATATDGWESDMDLALSFNVRDNRAARAVAINAVEPVIRIFESAQHETRPQETAHIDWADQTYATSWLRSVAIQPPLLEPNFDGLRTDPRTRRFLAENVFRIQDDVPLSVPVYPISRKDIYEELMTRFLHSTSRAQHNQPIGIFRLPPTKQHMVLTNAR